MTSGPVLGGFREAEQYTGLSRRNISRRLGEIEHVRIGARVLFTRAALDSFLDRYRVCPKLPKPTPDLGRIVAGLRRGAR